MMGLGRDDAGAIQVFEAIIVAVIILTAVLFFTTLQRPTQAPDVGGVDLGILASDILVVLAERNFTDPDDDDLELDLDGWVDRVMQGDERVAEDVDSLMDDILGADTRYEIRLANGIGHMRLLPFGPPQIPLAAKGASSFIVGNWTENGTETPAETTWPAATFDCTGVTQVTAPTGNQTGPDTEDLDALGDPWVDVWDASCGDAVDAADRALPAGLPYGIWGVQNATCAMDCWVEVTRPPSPADGSLERAEHPVYALQLLLWRGA